jgi:hypothetical protein
MFYTNNHILDSIVYVHIYIYISYISHIHPPGPALRSISGAPAQGGGRGAGGAQGQV